MKAPKPTALISHPLHVENAELLSIATGDGRGYNLVFPGGSYVVSQIL